MKKRKQTEGERIMGIPARGSALWADMAAEEKVSLLQKARRIDAAIRRAVAKALNDAFYPSIDASREYRRIDREQVAAKYNVKLWGTT